MKSSYSYCCSAFTFSTSSNTYPHPIKNYDNRDNISNCRYQQHRPFLCHEKKQTKIQTSINLSTISKDDETTVAHLANELKSILLSNETQKDNSNNDRIEELIQILSESNVEFNPETCINGPLFAVLHQSGPTPFWEKYDYQNIFKFRNIKGQRYRSIPATEEDIDTTTTMDATSNNPSFDLVNYAEFWGQNLSIQGCGVCTLLKAQSSSSVSTNTSTNTNTNSASPNSNSIQLLRCPVDYRVDIQNAQINIFKNQINLNVQGIGYTRILYADDELRIILAPKDTSDERWLEKAGLTVVQVRSDLVDPNFELM